MDNMTPLEKAKALLDARRKATQGEWVSGAHVCDWGFPYVAFVKTALHDPELNGDGIELRYGGKVQCINPTSHDRAMNQSARHDSDFIADAANHAEAICTRLVELESENAELRARMEVKG